VGTVLTSTPCGTLQEVRLPAGTLEPQGDGTYAIKSVSSGGYLDGRGGELQAGVSRRPAAGDKYLLWTLERVY
jgi:hypothetical protein